MPIREANVNDAMAIARVQVATRGEPPTPASCLRRI